MPQSVHLCPYPEALSERDEKLEKQMDAVITAVGLGRFLRSKHAIKTRQPLNKAIIAAHDKELLALLENAKDIIAEELNVKNIVLSGQDSDFINISAKANFKILGPKLGNKMKEIAKKISSLTVREISILREGKKIELDMDNAERYIIELGDIDIIQKEKEDVPAASKEGITVAIETRIDENLKTEGIAREIVSKIQNLRKEKGFDVSDRINLKFAEADDEIKKAFVKFKTYISQETLSLSIVEESEKGVKIPFSIDEMTCLLSIEKVQQE
jgi:isoleucyl-tRNA synthetase